MQAKVEVRLEHLKNAAKDLADELGVKLEFVQIKVELDSFGAYRQATQLHTLLQDHLDFRVQADQPIYKKDEVVISFDYDEDGEQ